MVPSRQMGRTGVQRRHVGKRSRTAKRKQPLSPGERMRLLRLVICGGAFVLLVAAKLLLPSRMEAFNAKLKEALERNMDVQAVFSAVGRSLEGGNAMQEVYRAVFQPEKVSQTVTLPEDTAAMDALRACRETLAAQPEEEAASQDGRTEVETLAYVLYSDENLPDNVSMEQAILGFAYSTPVQGALSSPFGYRVHPVEGEERFHYGVDLAADSGTAVSCFADGTVTAVGESSSYGKYCIVSHSGGYATLYAHCSKITAASGARVSRGEKIAEVGQTGIATGPHLHFEVHRDGVYLNPIYYVAAA